MRMHGNGGGLSDQSMHMQYEVGCLPRPLKFRPTLANFDYF